MAAISAERGVEFVMIYKDSINITKFKTFLEELRARNFYTPMCIISIISMSIGARLFRSVWEIYQYLTYLIQFIAPNLTR